MMRILVVSVAVCAMLALAACGGDDDGPEATETAAPGTSTAPGGDVEAKLASVLLQANEVPVGLQPSGLNFSDNSQVAGTQEELERLNTLGRLLGVDTTFVPSSDIPETEVVRGGIQNSASVYSNNAGASTTWQETRDSVRATDWQQQYPDLQEFKVAEVDRTVGDESIWLRITGIETCAVQTPAGSTATAAPTVTCSDRRKVVDDYVIFRAGRVRQLIKVLSAHSVDAPEDVFEDQVQAWAQIVINRSNEVFPPIP
jgi:hypothetical protein